MTFTPNREELAWSAGLFDGEGCIRMHLGHNGRGPGSARYRHLAVEINQNHREVLDRFCRAVGVGRVKGPYGPYVSATSRNPHWTFRATSFEESQHVAAVLWSFLSSPKREQAAEALRSYHKGAGPHY